MHQINIALEALKHVESKQEFHVLRLEHGDGARHVLLLAVGAHHHERRLVHASNNLARANALRNAAEPLVNEPRESCPLRRRLVHDGHLRAAVNKRGDRMSVDGHVHVQHDDRAESLRRVFHSHLHILLDVLLLHRLVDSFLSLRVHRVRHGEFVELAHALRLRLLRGVRLFENLLKYRDISVLDGARQVWILHTNVSQGCDVAFQGVYERLRVDCASVSCADSHRVLSGRRIRGGGGCGGGTLHANK